MNLANKVQYSVSKLNFLSQFNYLYGSLTSSYHTRLDRVPSSTVNITHKDSASSGSRADVLKHYAGNNPKRKLVLYGWGVTTTGALGMKKLLQDDKRHVQLTPLKLSPWSYDCKVERVACGYGTTCVVGKHTKDGRQVLRVAGLNTDCQLGSKHEQGGRAQEFGELSMLPATERIVDMACGRAHTIVATDQATVYCVGNNSYGQCGRKVLQDELFSENPVINAVKFDGSIKQVECGQDHSLVLLHDGRLFSCGIGSDGQTGQGHYSSVESFKEVGGDVKGERIVQVSSRADTVLAVSDKGDMFGWGNNEYEQLCSVSEEQQVSVARHMRGSVRMVAAAGSMCALVDDTDTVFTWGYGILGRGPAVERCRLPQPLPPPLFGALLTPQQGKGSFHVRDIQCGLHHFALLTGTGELYVWGRNKSACLGLGHNLDQYFPYKVQVASEVLQVACGVDHSIALCRTYL